MRPRYHSARRVIDQRLHITPQPLGRNGHLDLKGNRVAQVWFEGETDRFEIQATMPVRDLAPEAVGIADGSRAWIFCARADLEGIEPDGAVTAFAAELSLDKT